MLHNVIQKILIHILHIHTQKKNIHFNVTLIVELANYHFKHQLKFASFKFIYQSYSYSL